MNNDIINIINKIISDFSSGAVGSVGAHIATNILEQLKLFFIDKDNILKYLITRLTTDIKSENIVEPERNILIPSIEGMLLNEKDTIFHEMFYNLLKSSIDKNTKDYVHPGFVEILKLISPQEAKVLYGIKNDKLCNILVTITDKSNNALGNPLYKTIYKDDEKEYDYSSIRHRIHFLGLTYLEMYSYYDQKIIKYNSHNECKKYFKISLTDFGYDFMQICCSEKCDNLFELIDIKNYLEKAINK